MLAVFKVLSLLHLTFSSSPNKPQNLKTYIFYRHGARAPSKVKDKNNPENKKQLLPFSEEASDGSITDLGRLQSMVMGRFFRDEVQSDEINFRVITSDDKRSRNTVSHFVGGFGEDVALVEVIEGTGDVSISRGPKTGLAGILLENIRASNVHKNIVTNVMSPDDKKRGFDDVYEDSRMTSLYLSGRAHQMSFPSAIISKIDTQEKRKYLRKLWKVEKIARMSHNKVAVLGGKKLIDNLKEKEYKGRGKEFCSKSCKILPKVSSDITFISSHDSSMVTFLATIGLKENEIIIPAYGTAFVWSHILHSGFIWIAMDIAGLGLTFEMEQLKTFEGSEEYSWGKPIFGSDATRNINSDSEFKYEFKFFKNIPKTKYVPNDLCVIYGSCDNVILYEDFEKYSDKFFSSYSEVKSYAERLKK